MADKEKKEANPLDAAKDALGGLTKMAGMGGKEGGGGMPGMDIMSKGTEMLSKAKDMLDPSKAMESVKDLASGKGMKGMMPGEPKPEDPKDKEKHKPGM